MKIIEILEGEDQDEETSSFVSPCNSFSSLSSLSSSSSPIFPLSPSLTPLDRRAIGRDIEVRVSFDWLPFTYEEWYGHPQATATWAGMGEQASSSTGLLAEHAAGQTGEAWRNRPLDPSEIRVVLRVFREDGYHGDTFGGNPLNLFRPRKGRGWACTDTNRERALRTAVELPGVQSAWLDRTRGTVTITGHVDAKLAVKSFRRKSGWAEIEDVQLGPESQEVVPTPNDNASLND